MPRTAFLLLAWMVAACSPPAVLTRPEPVSPLDGARARAHTQQGARLLTEQGQVEKARAEFHQAIGLDPSDPVARHWAAWTAATLGDEEQAFDHLLEVIPSGHYSGELALWTAYRLFSTHSQGERLAAVLRALVGRPETDPLMRARASHFLGHVLRYLGDFDGSRKAFARLGYLSEWMVVGPFENDQNAGFETAYPPEQKFDDYSISYPGKLRPVRWRKVEHFDFDGRVNLSALLDPSRWACAYLVTFIHSDRSREIAVRLGAYRGVKVWMNNRLLHSDDRAHLAVLDQYPVGARLETGWNKLLVKVCQRTGPWQLRLRITDLAGHPVSGLRIVTGIQPVPDRQNDTTGLPRPDSFSRRLEKQPDDPFGFKSLIRATWSRRMGFYQRAVEQTVALAEAHPGCPLFQMALARAHFASDHEGSALKAIRTAGRLAPGLPDALLERARYEQRHKRYDRALKIIGPLIQAPQVLPAARMQQISLLADRGWTFDALQLALEFAKHQPDRPWLQRMIGSLHFTLDQPDPGMRAYQRARQARANHAGTYDRLINHALDRGDSARALELARAKNRVFPCLITSALKEAEILLAQGSHQAALEVCDRLEKIAPEYWYLHKLRGEIHYRRGNRVAALDSFHTALTLHPDNPTLRDYLDFLEQRRDEAFERYALGEARVEQILSNPPKLGEHPEAEAVFLLDDHVTHVFQDGSASHLVRQIHFIRTQKGQRQFDHFRVPASSSFRLEAAETIKPDGTRQEATSIRRGVIHFPALEPGSIVHVAYRYKSSSSSWMEDHFAMNFSFQGHSPEKQVRWVLVLPGDRKLQIYKQGDFIREQTGKLGDKQVYIWSAENTPLIHRDPLRPPARSLVAAVFVSTVPSWDVLAKWQNSLISDQFEIDSDVRKKTLELTRDAKSPLEKVEAIYQFVAKEIRYLDNDVGIFGKKPDKAVNIFENRYGDCKDKATLMIAMFKEVGIQAAYAGIRTFDRGPVFWEVPYAQTNHIITYIPAQEGISKSLFLDGTSRFGNLNYLPDRDQGLRALVLDGKGHQFVETPLLPPESSTLQSRQQARIEKTTLEIVGRDTWSGWFAYSHRSRLNVEGKRNEELAKELNYRYPGSELQKADFQRLDTLDPTAEASYQIRVPDRVRKESGTLRVNLLWPSNLARGIARLPERHYDIFMVFRINYDLQGTLALPPDLKVRKLPDPLSIDNRYVAFSQKCTSDKASITCSRKFTIKTRRVPLADYRQFREICGKIDAAEAQDIVLAGKK
jgi:tetratricopeptide (TPR) repeat protein